MNLEQWLERLEQLHPATIELGLERVSQVAVAMQLNLSASRVIVVGGTNGKGSTVALLSNILQLAGKTTATYTSPHISVYNERVSINATLASDEALCSAFEMVEQARKEISLTYFEFGTLAALYLFAQEKPDYVILEVGLGGRLDAVNIVDADLSILTNVALDHTEWLGEDREQIGFEKAGIFRAEKPAVFGEIDIPGSVLSAASKVGCKLYKQASQFFWNQGEDGAWSWQGVNLKNERVSYFHLPQTTIHLDNVSSVLQALLILEPDLSEQIIRQGIEQTHVSGRFQIIRGGKNQPTVVLDVAHNPHAAKHLVNIVKQRFPGNALHVVISMLKDKDLLQTSAILSALNAQWYVGEIKDERGASSKILYNHLLDLQAGEVSCFSDVEQALESAWANAKPQDIIIVTGSFFTVAIAAELFKAWG